MRNSSENGFRVPQYVCDRASGLPPRQRAGRRSTQHDYFCSRLPITDRLSPKKRKLQVAGPASVCSLEFPVNPSSPKSIPGPRGSPETFRSLDQLLTPASASHGEGRRAERKTAVVSHRLRPPEALSKAAHGRGVCIPGRSPQPREGWVPHNRPRQDRLSVGGSPLLLKEGSLSPGHAGPQQVHAHR